MFNTFFHLCQNARFDDYICSICKSKILSESLYRFRDKCAFAFYAEIQDQWTAKNGGKIIFGKSSPVDSVDTLWVKNFIEIALSRTVININEFLHFTQKFKIAPKLAGKRCLGKVNRLCTYSVSPKCLAPFSR